MKNIPDSRLVFSVENMHKINTIIYQSNRPQIPNVELFFCVQPEKFPGYLMFTYVK